MAYFKQQPIPDLRDTSQPAFTTDSGNALTKAINQMQKPIWVKKGRAPLAARRKTINQRLLKIIKPRPAVSLLQEYLPGLNYNIQQIMNPDANFWFEAKIIYNNEVIAKGEGSSHTEAKNAAAEYAIQNHLGNMLQQLQNSTQPESEIDDKILSKLNLPGLASFAVYRLFQEWQEKGFIVPMNALNINAGPKSPSAAEKKMPRIPKTPKVVPADAKNRHPTVLLNELRPGLPFKEVSRTTIPFTQVTVEIVCDGTCFTAEGPNRKEARKNCSKKVLSGLFGVVYDDIETKY